VNLLLFSLFNGILLAQVPKEAEELGGPGGMPWLRQARQITTSTFQDFQGAVSPDGRWLVFVSDRTGNQDLWLRSLAPGTVLPERQLTQSTVADAMPCWSPDGKSVAFVSNAEDTRGDIVVLEVESGKKERLTDRTTADSHPTWAPDGQTIAYAAAEPGGSERICALHLKSRKSKPLASTPGRNPSFSPDGKLLVFDSFEGDPTGNIWVVAATGGTPHQLTSGDSHDLAACFASDGKRVFFTRFADDTNRDGKIDTNDKPSIWCLPFDPGAGTADPRGPFPLTSGEHYSIFPAAWGTKVVYTSDQGKGLDLWALPQEGLLSLEGDAERQFAMARRIEDRRPAVPFLALMAYLRFLRDFGDNPGAERLAVEARYRLASVYREIGSLSQSESELRGLLAAHPAAGQFAGLARVELLRIELDRALRATDDPAKRRESVERAVTEALTFETEYEAVPVVAASAALARGTFWLAIKGDPQAKDNALLAFGKVASSYPKLQEESAEALYRQASVYEELGGGEDVLNAYLLVPQRFASAKRWCGRAAERVIGLIVGSEGSADERVQKLRGIVEQYKQLSVLPALAQNRIGDTFYEMVETAKAKEAYQAVTRDFGQEAEQAARAQFALAKIYCDEEDYEKALAVYSQVQQEFRAGNDAFYELARQRFVQRKLERAERHLTLFREPQVALREYQQLIDFDYEIVEAHRGAVMAAEVLDRAQALKKAQADPKLKAKATLQDLHPALLEALARYQRQIEGWKKADDPARRRALHVAHYSVGLIYTYFDEADYLDTAVDFIQKAVTLDSEVAFAHQTLGFCYERKAILDKKGRLRPKPDQEWLHKAIEEYLIALALNDEESNEQTEVALLVNIGNGFFLLNDPKQAYEYYSVAFDRFESLHKERKSPFDNDERSLLFLERFGQAAFQRQRLDESIASLRLAAGIAGRRRDDTKDAAARKQRNASLAEVTERLALSLQEAARHKEAAELFLLVRDMSQELGNEANRAKAARNAAYNYFRHSKGQGEVPDEEALTLALANLEESLRNVRSTTERKKAAETDGALVTIEQQVGLADTAEAALGFDKTGEERLLYTYIGSVFRESLDYPKAIQAYKSKLGLYPETPPEGQKVLVNTARSVIVNQLGYFHFQLGEHEQARQCFEQSAALAQAVGNQAGVVINAANLGRMACARLRAGEPLAREAVRNAIRSQEQALELIRREKLTGLNPYRMHLANHLGVLYHALADIEKDTLATVEKDGISVLIANSVSQMEHAGASAAWFSRALQFLEEQKRNPSLSLWQDTCSLLYNQAEVAAAQDPEMAEECLKKAWDCADTCHLYAFQWKIRFRQALLAEPDRQLDLLKEAVDLLEQSPPLDPFPAGDHSLADALYRLAVKLLLERNETDQAFLYAERSQEQALVAQTRGRHYAFEDERYRAAFDALWAEREKLLALRQKLGETPPGTGEGGSDRHSALQRQYTTALGAYRDMLGKTARELPELASLLQVNVTPAEDLQANLSAQSLYVRYTVAGGKVNAWVLTNEGFSHHSAVADPAILAKLRRPAPGLSKEEHEQLSALLLAPIAEAVKSRPRLYLAVDNALAEAPWSELVLPDGKRLVEQAEMAFLSGTSHGYYASYKESPYKRSLLLVGEAMESQDPRRGQFLPTGVDFAVDRVGETAKPGEVLQRLPKYDAVHLGRPLELKPGQAIDSTILAGGRLKRFSELRVSQAIAMGQSYSMTEYNKDLNNGLITVSRIGVPNGFGGRGAVDTLARAFTFAGFPTMLAYVPAPGAPADKDGDQVARFIGEFYRLWRTRPAGEAIRKALLWAAEAGVPAHVASRFRLYGHLGFTESEAHDFATMHLATSIQVAEDSWNNQDWLRAVRYYENALSLVEALGEAKRLPDLYEQLSVAACRGWELSKAILYGEKKADILKDAPDRDPYAKALCDLADIYKEAERYPEAVAAFGQAMDIFSALGEAEKAERVFSALGGLGNVQQFSGNYQGALQTLGDSVQRGEKLRDTPGIEARTKAAIEAEIGWQLRRIGAIYYRRLNDNPRADEHYRRALDVFRRRIESGRNERPLNDNPRTEEDYRRAFDTLKQRIEDPEMVIRLTLDLGLVQERRADFPGARETYQQALELVRNLRAGKADSPGARDPYQEALELARKVQTEEARLPNLRGLYQQAIDLASRLRATALESEALSNIANTHWFQGDYQKAFEFQRKALQSARDAGNRFREEVVLNTLGLIYWTLNDYDRALEKLTEALSICLALPGTNGRVEVASTHNNIGLVYRSKGEYETALESFRKALEIDRAIQSEWGIAYDERNMGMTYLRMGRAQEAADLLRSAAARCRKIGDVTNLVKSLYSLGDACLALNDPDAAEKSYGEALETSRKVNIREVVWRSEQGLGKVALARKQPNQAFAHFKEAIEVVEKMRAAIKIEEFKNGFVTNKLDLYEDMIFLLLDQGKAEDAFSYAERSRARNFIDLLENRSPDVGNPKDSRFLQRQGELKRKIEGLQDVAARAEGEEKAAKLKELEAAQHAYEDLVVEMRLDNPELSSFVSVSPLALPDLQKLLEPGVTLLEYLVGEKEVVAWVIKSNSVGVQRTPCERGRLAEKILTYRKLMQSIKDFKEESKELFGLLVKPVQDKLAGTQRLGIVPHDCLHYLSFASLHDGEDYFVERYPLFYVPSASVLKYSLARRGQTKNRRVLAIGNPDLQNEALELPFAEREVDSIRWPFPEVDVLKRGEATEKALVERSPDYGIIHIASHGEFDAVNPLFSRILLAAAGETDGSLNAEEVFRLTLHADLVVLSACQSGLGKVEKGDEIIGLNRAFTYAGTHSLLSTLWRVNDVTTAILVKHFYRNYAAQDKATSLRKAQLLVKRYYPHPSYWAAFVLTGDYQ
jgi:CHAT domain-containing protein